MKKSAAELAFMRQAGQIAALAQKAAFDTAAPGVRQCDVMAELYKVTTAGTPEFGGTFPCKPPNAMVNEIASAPHLSWSDEKLKAGDLFYIEMAGCGTATLAAVALHLSRQADRAHGHDRQGDRRGAGRRARQGEARRAVRGAGRDLDTGDRPARHREGQPYRLSGRHRFPADLGELTASLRAGDHTVMEEGMTFHCIPAIWLDTYGLVISESFAVTNARRVLRGLSADLVRQGVKGTKC